MVRRERPNGLTHAYHDEEPWLHRLGAASRLNPPSTPQFVLVPTDNLKELQMTRMQHHSASSCYLFAFNEFRRKCRRYTPGLRRRHAEEERMLRWRLHVGGLQLLCLGAPRWGPFIAVLYFALVWAAQVLAVLLRRSRRGCREGLVSFELDLSDCWDPFPAN